MKKYLFNNSEREGQETQEKIRNQLIFNFFSAEKKNSIKVH